MKTLLRVLVAGALGLSSAAYAEFPEAFSWQNWHGSDWVTIGKDQHVQGPCNIFAGVALTESIFSLYYNRTGLVNLAEEHLNSFSCMEDAALTFGVVFPKLQSQGVVNENCVPYPSDSQAQYGAFLTSYHPAGASCTKPCDYPGYKIRLGGYDNNPDLSTNEKIKHTLMHRGPIAINMNGFQPLHNGYPHAYLVIGWEERSDGLYWQLKDSWPDMSGSRIYYHKFDLAHIDRNNLYYMEAYVADVSTPVDRYTWNGTWTKSNPAATCSDRDNDGYWFWGLGPRPSGCSGEADSNDGDPEMGPFDDQGGVTYINEPVPTSAISISRYPDGGSYLCPDTRYWLTANVDTDYSGDVTDYQWRVSWHATPVTSLTGSSYLQIDTYPDSQFGRVEYGVRVKNDAGWSDYKDYFLYRGYSCGDNGW